MIIKHDMYYAPAKQNRMLHIWLPDSYDHSRERYPVMYFFDGHNLFRDEDATFGKSWGMADFLSRWHKNMIIVGIECSHEGNQRLCEYLPYKAGDEFFGPLEVKGNVTLDWLLTEVKPWVDSSFRTYPFRECTAIGGSSMGGLMAIRAVTKYNRWFSKAACISSAIGFCPDTLLSSVSSCHLSPDTRVYLSWGSREAWGASNADHMDVTSDSYRWNRAVADKVRRSGGRAKICCQEGGGHSEYDWQKLVPDFMHFLWLED